MLDRATTLEVLRSGELEVVGRIVESTNNALFVRLTRPCPDPEPAVVIEAIHKPTLGERPLDDFPDGTLAQREVAAWLVSEAMGWDLVPPTILRDGPFGNGMLQAYVDIDDEVDVWTMVIEDDPRLRRMATFDAAVNNTDRKGGHILPVDGGRHLYGVDHGVTFSVVPKLRTVLWGWRGQPFGDDELAGLRRLREALAADGGLADELRGLLSGAEIRALARRVDGLLTAGRFPYPSPTWPAVPWPPF
ncbi:MAG: SCO1664 family protein [Chloroflexota bacterium]